jgi:transcriptional regulator with XRE-family HTH domain
MARRKAGYSQQALADALGLSRSAVGNWEAASNGNPSSANLSLLAKACDVSYEWLATGRGEMFGSNSGPAVQVAHAVLVEDPIEMRLLDAWRNSSTRLKLLLLELAEIHSGSNRSNRRTK